MKVKITMEADVTNLPAFNEDVSVLDINGAGRENVYDVVKGLYINSLTKLMKQRAEKNLDPARQEALVLAYEDECNLTKQLTDNVKISFRK
jgi:hypothetical protein